MFNIDSKVSKYVTVGGKLSFSNELNSAAANSGSISGGAFSTGGLGRLQFVLPSTLSPFNNDGSYNLNGAAIGSSPQIVGISNLGYYNPQFLLDNNKESTENNRVQGNVYGQLKPFSWLTARTQLGLDFMFSDNNVFWSPRSGDGYTRNGYAWAGSDISKVIVWTNTLQLDKSFASHNLSLLLGNEQQFSKYKGIGIQRENISDPDYDVVQAGFTINNPANLYKSENYLVSFFTRLNYNFARSTVTEVYTQILKDLNEAETDLPLANASAILNTSMVHRNTVVAFKTRVYLSMQKYAEAVTEANKIVSSSAPFVAPSGVANKLEANIATVFTNYTTTESIFSLPMSSTAGDFPGKQNQIAYYWTHVASLGGVGNGEYSVNPSGILANTTQFTKGDKRRAFIVSSNSGTKLWNMKFKTPDPYMDWVPVIRYSEVLLNLAEAKVRASNVVDSQSLALLNAVHGRSDAGKVFVASDFSTPSEFLLAIDNERRMEFIGEGHRTRDVTRLLSAFPAHGTASAKALGDVGYIWPIPSLELSLNTLCVDN